VIVAAPKTYHDITAAGSFGDKKQEPDLVLEAW
jgi:hypothetical protein